MSAIANLLIEQARIAAESRARSGALWGNAISGITQVPGQVVAAQQAKDERDRNAALLQARETRESAAAADESKLRNLQIAGVQQGQAQQHALDTIWGSGILKDDGSVDTKKAQDLATQAGMPHLVPAIIDQANKWNASAVDLAAKKDAAAKSAIELQARRRCSGRESERLRSWHISIVGGETCERWRAVAGPSQCALDCREYRSDRDSENGR